MDSELGQVAPFLRLGNGLEKPIWIILLGRIKGGDLNPGLCLLPCPLLAPAAFPTPLLVPLPKSPAVD